MKIKKFLIVLATLSIISLFIFGCTREGTQYPAGYAPQQQYPTQQGYVGGGCAVVGPDTIYEYDKIDVQIAA